MKTQELLIHLGHGKTGTTTLQRTLAQSTATLMQSDIFFPDLHPQSGNGFILGYHLLEDQPYDAGRTRARKVSHTQTQKLSKSKWAQILKTIEEKQPNTLLFSSEMYFNRIRQDTIQRFDQLTNDVAKTKTAIAYLRAPHAYFLSSIQQRLKKVRSVNQVSPTRIRDTLEPLYDGWSGNICLHVFDRSTMIDGDIVTDFVSKHLPSLDQGALTRPPRAANTSLSAEAMSLLYDRNQGRLNQNVAPQVLIDQIMKADHKIEKPTKPKLLPGTAEALIDWSAPDLFWLRDTKDIVFPNIDYDAIKTDQTVRDPINFERIEQFCEVNPDRKALLYARAEKRAKLPSSVRRWLAHW